MVRDPRLGAIFSAPPKTPFDSLENEQAEPIDRQWSTWDTVKSLGASFVEGFAMGIDLFEINNDDPLHPWAHQGAVIAGEITRMIPETLLAGGLVSLGLRGIRAVPWIGRALRVGGPGAQQFLTKYPQFQRAVQSGANTLGFLTREAAQGITFTGLEYGAAQLLDAEERVPGVEDAVMNIAQFVGGGAGLRLSQGVINRFVPYAGPGTQRFFSFAGDAVGSTAGALVVADSPEQIINAEFAAETIAIGVADLLLYGVGRLSRTPETLTSLQALRDAQRRWELTHDPRALTDMYVYADRAFQAGVPAGEIQTAFADRFWSETYASWVSQLEAQRTIAEIRREPIRSPDAATALEARELLQTSLEAAQARQAMRRVPERITSVPEGPQPVVHSTGRPVTPPEGPRPIVHDTGRPVQLPEEPRPAVQDTPRPVQLPEEPRPTVHDSPPPQTRPLTGERIIETFGYNRSRAPEIDRYVNVLNEVAQETGFTVEQLAALAKIESDFRDVGSSKSSARGVLQVTNIALRDLENWGVQLTRDINTPEGRIEAGAKYLQLLRDQYGFQGDELIAAYFSGPTYVRNNGITDQVIEGQHSNREYVRRYLEAYEDITSGRVRETPTDPAVRQRIEDVPAEGPRPEVHPQTHRGESQRIDTPEGPSSPEVRPVIHRPESHRVQPPQEPPKPQPRSAEDLQRIVREGDVDVPVRFEDPIDAALFDYAVKQEIVQNAGIRHGLEVDVARAQLRWADDFLRRQLDLSSSTDVSDLASRYHVQVRDMVREWRKGDLLTIPRSEFPRARVEPPTRTTSETPTRDVEAPPRTSEAPPRTSEAPVREIDPMTRRDVETPPREPETPPRRDAEAPPVRESETPPRRDLDTPTRDVDTPPKVSEVPPRDVDYNLVRNRLYEIFGAPSTQPRQAERGVAQGADPQTLDVPGAEIERVPLHDRVEFRDTERYLREYEQRRRGELTPEQHQELQQWILDHTGEVSAEELARLRTIMTPRAGYPINTTRMISSGENLRALQHIADVANGRRPRTLEGIEAEARERLKGQDLDAVGEQLGLLQKDVEILKQVLETAPEVVTAYRALVVAHGAELMETAKKIAREGGSDLEYAKFAQQEILQANLVRDLTQIAGGSGQLLASMRIRVDDRMIDLSELTPVDVLRSVDAAAGVEAAITAAGGREAIRDRARRVAEAKDLSGLNDTVRKNTDDKVWMRMLAEQRGASLLQNFRTTARNIISQIAHSGLEHATNYLAAGMTLPERALSRMGLIRGRDGLMTFSEANARLVGDLAGVFAAFTRPVVTIRDAAGFSQAVEAPSTIGVLLEALASPQKMDQLIQNTSFNPRLQAEGMLRTYGRSSVLRSTPQGRALSTVADILGSPLQLLSGGKMTGSQVMWWMFDGAAALQRTLGYGMMDLADRPFSYGAYYSELAGQMHRLSRSNPDLDTSRLWDQVLAYRGYALKTSRSQVPVELPEILKGLSETDLQRIIELDTAALNHSQHMTWKDPIESEALQSFVNFVNRHPALRVTMLPFAHTPARILEKSMAMSPIAPLHHRKMRDDLLGRNGVEAQYKAAAQWAIGTGLFIMGVNLAAENLITPGARDGDEYRRMEEAGIPPNSINIGRMMGLDDFWIDMTSIDPAPAFFFNTTANLYRAAVEGEEDDLDWDAMASSLLFSIIHSVADKTWMTSISQFIDALYGIRTESLIREQIQSLAFYGAHNFLTSFPIGGLNPFYRDYLMETNSFIERYLPQRPRVDRYGQYRRTRDHFMGIYVGTGTDSPIRREVMNLGLELPTMPRTVNGVQLSDELYHEIQRAMHTVMNAEETLNELVTSPAYQESSAEAKRRMIRSLYDRLQAGARRHVLGDEEFIEDLLEQRQRDNLRLLDSDYPWDWFGQQ